MFIAISVLLSLYAVIGIVGCADTAKLTHGPDRAICISPDSSPLDYFNGLIDLFTFTRLDRKVFLPNPSNRDRFVRLEETFAEYHQKHQIKGFDEKYGKQFATHMSSFLLFEPVGAQMDRSVIVFVSATRRLLEMKCIDGRVYMALLRSLFEAGDSMSIDDTYMEKVLLAFMFLAARQEAVDMNSMYYAYVCPVGMSMDTLSPNELIMYLSIVYDFPKDNVQQLCDRLCGSVAENALTRISGLLDSAAVKFDVEKIISAPKNSIQQGDFENLRGTAEHLDNAICWFPLAHTLFHALAEVIQWEIGDHDDQVKTLNTVMKSAMNELKNAKKQ